MTEIDVTGFRQAVDGQPKGLQEAILAGFVLGGGDEEALRKGLIQRMGQTLGIIGTTEHFREKPVKQVSPKQVEVQLSAETMAVDGEVLLWAEGVRNEFISLPDKQPKKGDKAKQRDRRFLINAFDNLAFNGDEPKNALYQPNIVARALESWMVLADDDQTERTQELIETATSYLSEAMAKKWQKIPKETLAGYTRELAHGSLAEQHLESLLRSYFEGPKNKTDRLQSYTNFCLSAQYVIEDQVTISEIAKIVNFTTDILPRDGQVHAAVFNFPVNLADPVTLRMSNEAHRFQDTLCLMGLQEDSNINRYSLQDDTEVTARTTERDYMRRYDCDLETAQAELAKIEAIIREHETSLRLSSSEVEAIRTKYGERAAMWATDYAIGMSEGEQEYLETFGHRAEALKRVRYLESQGVKVIDVVNVPVGENIFEIYIAEGSSLTPEDYKQAIAEFTARVREMVGEERWSLGPTLPREEVMHKRPWSIPAISKVEYRGETIWTCARPRCEYDGLQDHDLNILLLEDVPDIEGNEFASSKEIAQRIKDTQRWFVGPRTFEVEFKSNEMREAGFYKIAFRRPEGEKVIHVTLTHQEQVIEYRINANWQLDLEGRGIHSDRLKDIIERRTLAILEAYSTKDVLETSKGTISEHGSSPGIGFVPAMLVWVGGFRGDGSPKGFSDDQWLEYLEREGKDLAVESAKRLEREDSNGRMSTYRKSYGLPDGPPIELYVEDERII